MVSITGAQQAQPLIQKIAAIEASIASLEAVIGYGGATIWKMSADVYLGKTSQSLALQYDLSADDSAPILAAVLSALQSELKVINAELEAIS